MNCREIQNLLTSYLLGDLEPAQAEDMRVHLQTCELCRNDVEALQTTLQLLREGLADNSTVPSRLPENFIQQFNAQDSWRLRIAKPKPPAKNWRLWATQFTTIHYMAVAAMLFILAGAIIAPISVSHYQAVRGTFEGGDQLLVLAPPGPPPPPATAMTAGKSHAMKTVAAARLTVAAASVSETEDSNFLRRKKGVSYTYAQPTADKDAYASTASTGADKPADASKYKEAEGAERKEESAKPLVLADLSPAKQDSSRLSAAMAARSGLPPPPMPSKAVSAKTTATTKDVYRGAKLTVSDSTMASVQHTATEKFAVSEPASYVQPSVPVVAPSIAAIDVKIDSGMGAKIAAAEVTRLGAVRNFQKGWAQSGGSAGGSYRHGGGKGIRAKFTIFKAKYQDADWDCNPDALKNLMLQMHAWSKDRIDAQLLPEVIDIGADKLFTLKPPFVYLTGQNDFHFQDNEVKNLRDYLTLGGAVWADSADIGKGSRFDTAFRREITKVLPDRSFEIVSPNHEMYDTFFENIGQPPGWANSRAPTEIINIGGKLAVLYTLNNYGKLWTYRLDKDGSIDRALSPKIPDNESQSTVVTDELVRNAYKFGINMVVHLLTRYQRDFMLLPKNLPLSAVRNIPATNAVPAPEPAASNTAPVAVPVCRATGVNPFVFTATKPFSTFSIDVDTASYTLSRNYLLRGQLPPPEAVRTEEFVNYFDYDYAPPNGPTFAVYADCGPSAFGRGLSMLKVGVKGRRLGREEKRSAVLTLLIDTSGSMATPDRIELVKSALAQMVERLGPADKVAIVQYDSHARLLLEHTPASDKKRILAVIDGLQTSGSTSLEEGMREAYATAARGFNSGAGNRVLLLSDGMANLGSTEAEDILKSVAGYRKQGITLSVFGFGLGAYNDVMLETLANKGDGVYAFIDSPAEAKRVLVDDLAATVNLIARDVKIQVEFNQKRVKQYRQLGYENRQLKKEQFRDDSVDAGEIGSGQSVTALYELELQGDSTEPLGMVRVRCRNALTGQIEEIEQPITPPAGRTPFEAMDVRFRLATAAAEFAEILRGSPFAAGNQFEDVARVLRPVALELSLDNRIQEFLRMTLTGLSPKFQEPENP